MYEAYWQLSRRPFESTSDPSFYYPCEAHQGALLKLRYAIENARGAALLTGSSGIGKTLVIHTLRRQLDERFQPFVHVTFPVMPQDELLAYLADSLSPTTRATTPGRINDSVRRIEFALAENASRAGHAVVVIDEAHLISDPTCWETLRLLGNFQGDLGPHLTLILSGQASLLPMMDRMPAWEERLGVKCLMRPLTLEETMGYISHRMTASGALTTIFDATAMEAVFYLTHGNARQINRLCDLTLLIAFAEEQPGVTSAQVEAVAQELASVAPE